MTLRNTLSPALCGQPRGTYGGLHYQHRTAGAPEPKPQRDTRKLSRAAQQAAISAWFEAGGVDPTDAEWNALLARHFGGKGSD